MGQGRSDLKVKEPIESEWPGIRRGQVLFTYFHFAAAEPLTKAILKSGCVAIAYETVQLASGELPLLTPMSEVAGAWRCRKGRSIWRRRSAGADSLGRGAGRACRGGPGHRRRRRRRQRAKMAAGLGAHVTLLDISLDACATSPMSSLRMSTCCTRTATIFSSRSTRPMSSSARCCSRAPRRPTRQAAGLETHEARVGDRGRCGRPGRVHRKPSTDHPRSADLRGGRNHSLRRGEHAGRRAAHLDAGAHHATFPYAKRLAKLGWKQACKADAALFLGLKRDRRPGRVSGRRGGVQPALADPKTLV